MNIHEYQAKELLSTFGVPVPAGSVAFNSTQARQAAETRQLRAAEARKPRHDQAPARTDRQ